MSYFILFQTVWWRMVEGKEANIEEWKKLLRTARNRRILHMSME
jgi:hypothetical protein